MTRPRKTSKTTTNSTPRSSRNKSHYFTAEVVRMRVGGPHAVMELTAPEGWDDLDPGQFAMVLCDTPGQPLPPDPLLNRPFSVSDVWREEDASGGGVRFSLLLKAIGRGTRWLWERRPGDRVNLLGPLGTGLEDPARVRDTVIVIGGGSGIAPLLLYTRRLVPAGKRVIAVVGANILADLPLEQPYDLYEPGSSTRETGNKPHTWLGETLQSLGAEYHAALMESRDGYFHGTTIDKARQLLAGEADPNHTTLIACGPHGMMRAAHDLAAETGAECYVLLESMMACGTAVCRSCVTTGYARTEKGELTDRVVNKTVCTDGPLFDSREIAW